MLDPMYVRLGSHIRRCRDQVGMTQAELASRVGLSRTSVTNIERGRQPVLVHQLCVMADALRADVCVLIGEARIDVAGAGADGAPEFEALLGKLNETPEGV